MSHSRAFVGAAALACSLAFAASPAAAEPTDYRFEVVGKPSASGGKDVVRIRLVHVPDGKAQADVIIFEAKADMGPAGMQTMTAPVKPLPAKDGVYGFEVEPGMTGTWALHLAAKVQGEADTVRGTVNADLVK